MSSRTIANVHGITRTLMGAGCYVIVSPRGRKVAVSDRTRRLIAERRPELVL